MFVLRAKVEIAPSDEWHAAALVGADDAWLAAHALPSRYARRRRRDSRRASLDSNRRSVVACGRRPRGRRNFRARVAARAAPTKRRSPKSSSAFRRSAQPLVEHFVPQMLNLDLLDALSFDKGCYPGQEVIARVHHLRLRQAPDAALRLYLRRGARARAPPSSTAPAARREKSCASARAAEPAPSCSRSSTRRRPAGR